MRRNKTINQAAKAVTINCTAIFVSITLLGTNVIAQSELDVSLDPNNPIAVSTRGVLMLDGVFYPSIGVVALEQSSETYNPQAVEIKRLTALLEGGLSWSSLSPQEKVLISYAKPELSVSVGGSEALNLVPIELQSPELTQGYMLYMDSWYDPSSPFSPEYPEILITPDNAQEWAALSEYLRTPDANVNLVFKALFKYNKPLSQIDWTAVDITGWNLSNMDFSSSNLYGEQISKASGFVNTNLSGLDLEGFSAATRDLTGANLSRSTITGTQLNGATSLAEANLSGLDLTGLSPIGTNMESANLSNTFGLAAENLVKANSLKGAVLTGSGITADLLKNALIREGKDPNSKEFSNILF